MSVRSPIILPKSGQILSRICVSISGASPGELIRNSNALYPDFPFQEFRLDYLSDPAAAIPHLGAHLSLHSDAIFLATCRREPSGGRFPGSPEDELHILLEAAQTGFALVDLSLESAEALGSQAVQQLRATGASMILSWHGFERTGDLAAVLARMRPFGPDLCKIIPTANSLHDNLPLLELLRTGNHPDAPPIIGLSMGEQGIPSRVLGVRTGSGFTFAAAETATATAPGQISASTLRDLYRLDKIDGNTEVYGVAGAPIRSSLSPLMLNRAFAHTGRNAVLLPLLTHNPEDLLAFARSLGLSGCSVTMPLKQTILPLLDRVDPLAARIGAVNTLRRAPDGSFEGFNTDAAGVVAPLETRLRLQGAQVLVLGAGGAARAAVFGCANRGAEVSILSRRPEQAQQLAHDARVQAIRQEQLADLPECDVLINATPAGMRGNPTELPIRPEEIRARLVFDLVYNPLDTPLLRAARARGIETISGVEMFIQQGARQFELWTDQPAPVETMREAVLHALTNPAP